MAVELDVLWAGPYDQEVLRLQIEEILQEQLHLITRPSVSVDAVAHQSGAEVSPDDCGLRMRIGEIAAVSVMPYVDASDGRRWACVSYVSLRSPQSKILCLAAAVALAEHGGAAILDDGNLFGAGRWIDPAHAFDGMVAPEEAGDFPQQAVRAAGRVEMRRKLRAEE